MLRKCFRVRLIASTFIDTCCFAEIVVWIIYPSCSLTAYICDFKKLFQEPFNTFFFLSCMPASVGFIKLCGPCTGVFLHGLRHLPFHLCARTLYRSLVQPKPSTNLHCSLCIVLSCTAWQGAQICLGFHAVGNVHVILPASAKIESQLLFAILGRIHFIQQVVYRCCKELL